MSTKFWKLLGAYNAETTTYSALAVSGMSSPYTPGFTARLKALRAIMNRDAATTLQNHVQFKLTSDSFDPNSIECGSQGSGLQTAPALQPPPDDFECDLQVDKGCPIYIEARNVTADTPVTVSCLLYGYFEKP